ncbi:MAG: polyphosphate polymerase domain-containing protein [Clostridia bacterium]|nr:polyphosphate polymerase domain-containing protein [Clostridia bacterium]
MAIEVFNRYENKFLLDSDTLQKLETRLLDYVELDEYNQSHPFYTITNLYFDTEDNHLIRTSLAKPRYKEKLRLRAYGVPKPDDKVFLEIKKKVDGLVNKRRTVISLKEAYSFIDTGQQPPCKGYMNSQVLNEIDYLMKRYPLMPKLYLAYDRRAYFSRDNRDLRITLDTGIRTRRYDLRLEMGDYGESLLASDQWLMEIKAGATLPYWLTRLLAEYRIYKTSFSKYGREYEKRLVEMRERKGENKVCLKRYSEEPMLAAQYQL